MKVLTFFSVCLLACHAVLAATAPSKSCVLNVNGIEDCTIAPSALPATVRQTAPCEKMDMKCWCMKAKDYTNDVRRRHGRTKMLEIGPTKQLDNAVSYAGVLGDMGFLQHQNLGDATRKVGCGRFIGGENIAYNYESGDVAKACVDQWEGSSGHLENILRDSFAEVVVGFHYEPDGRVYCVQTFTSDTDYGTVGSRSDAGCEPVSAGSGPKPTKPAPTKPVTTTPAPTRPVTTKPAPTMPPKPTGKPVMTQKMKDEGNRSCRCIELGRKCWRSLRKLSGNRCEPFTPARRQSMMCKGKCCGYCKYYPNTPPCKSRRVRRICKML